LKRFNFILFRLLLISQLLENRLLKRAAILFFYNNPEKFFTGAYIKIVFFQTDDDLKYQDEVHGNLFEQTEKAMDLLLQNISKQK
jgi:ATP-dependent DNA helicase RecG